MQSSWSNFAKRGKSAVKKHIGTLVLAACLFFCSTSAVFAAANPNVTIVNPVSGKQIYSDNLLVSVKMTAASTIFVSVTQEFKIVNGENTTVSLEEYLKAEKSETSSVLIGNTDSFTSANNLSFYTKKVENVKPGIYRITVNTVDADNKILFTNDSTIEIKPKEENPADTAVIESQQSGAAQFLKNLLKIIFRE